MLSGAIAVLYCSRSQLQSLLSDSPDDNFGDALRGLIVKLLDTPGGACCAAAVTWITQLNGRTIVSLELPHGGGHVNVPITRLLDDPDISLRLVACPMLAGTICPCVLCVGGIH